ncbi:arginase family protein [Heyndrickxia camelliae]
MMGLLNKEITIMNFDETYFTQQKLQQFPHENINVQQLKHVNLYCEEDSITRLYSFLQKRQRRGITFIGSGNYHYVTYLLLKEMKKPFTLVLFDNHPDLSQHQGDRLLSCGSWVSYALSNNPLLKKVVIIGPTVQQAASIHNPRISVYSFKDKQTYSTTAILSAIPTDNVYISIDKDVLNTNEVQTNWDQGVMTVDMLIHYLTSILQFKKVEGVDICGEEKLSPLQAILPDYQTIILKNEKANLKILQSCLKEAAVTLKGA